MVGELMVGVGELMVVTTEAWPFGVPVRGRSKDEVTEKTRLHSLSPDPPATLESCANPIEAGSARKTEYTFFCKAKRREISIRYAIQKESTSQKGIPNNPGGMA